MKIEDQYLKFVRWEDEDGLYVGYCADLFPWGGICHGTKEEETYGQLCALVREEVEDLVKARPKSPLQQHTPHARRRSGLVLEGLTFPDSSSYSLSAASSSAAQSGARLQATRVRPRNHRPFRSRAGGP